MSTSIVYNTKVQFRRRRRLSTPNFTDLAVGRLVLCQPLPKSLDALDLSSSSPTQTLASLRFLVLSYLAELERRLSQLESPDLEAWRAKGETTIEDARQWARTALEMLDSIRTDVCSHLPELHFADISVESLVSSFPDLPDVCTLNDMRSRLADMADVRSHLPDLPHLPDMDDVRARLPEFPDMDNVRAHLPDFPDVRSKLGDIRTRFQEIDFNQPLNYVPTLYNHLRNLHSHLSSAELPSGLTVPALAPSTMLSDLLDSIMSSEVMKDILSVAPDVREGEELLEKAARDVASAIKRSLHGVRLISYQDLPEQWKSNPYVTSGYRFIPLERWPLLLMSLFAFHNETLNIHTHLIPFFLWGSSLIPYFNTFSYSSEELFMAFALLCLFSSALWHTMAGCAHSKSMDFCARIDYVGIGWLISASVGTIVHHGFRCHPKLGQLYLALCFCTGVAGNIFPFMDWFNRFEYRFYRIAFFLALAFSALAPVANLATLHSFPQAIDFFAPVVPSLLSYIIGLVFYATHSPERFLSDKWARRVAEFGIGSHSIWHCFIVLAVYQHKTALSHLKHGIECAAM